MPRVTDTRAHAVRGSAPVRWEKLPAACHSATRRKEYVTFSTYAAPSLRAYVRTPVTPTYLKPEAARSLFPRLIDCNQKRSTHHFPRKRRVARSQNRCLFVKCPSLPTLRPLADAFGLAASQTTRFRQFQPRLAPWGAHERGAPPDPPHKAHGQKPRTCLLPQVMSLWRRKRSTDGRAKDRPAPFALQ